MSAWTVPSYAEGWTVPGYVEERLLGQGASGRVVAAASELTGQRVAIKYLSPALVRDPSFMWSFRTEAQTLRALDVPQVVKLYDYVEAPGQGAAIVMEMVDGVSLHAMISQQGPTTPESALMVLKGSLLGLAAAHALGIVHRDYKPENVLVDARGDSKLSDFGVAIKAGKKALAAGTPLYMAPEQWNGAPNSPATDIYAATAVFFECVTARTPFSGKLGQLRQQHETASVPLEQVDPSLQHLIARGMAKNPVERPQSAIAFVSELESTAAAAYGPDWEERGRSHLAERVAALLPLLLLLRGQPGSSGTSSATTWLGQPKRKALTIATIAAAAVIAAGAAATAVTLSSRSHQESLSSSSKAAAAVAPTFTVQASVTPPVTAAACTTPSTPAKPGTFAYRGTITATAPGAVRYQWVYSSGKPGPVQTAHFAAAGHKQVTGEVAHPAKASTGWGEIKLLNAGGKTSAISNKASFRLLCAGAAGGIVPVASVQPATATLASCAAAAPTITATGSITTKKAETVTYYWALANGVTSAPATLTFTGPTTMAVSPLTYKPSAAPASGEAVLVVTSPVGAASAPATYSISCTAQKLSATAAVSPATQSLASCTAAAPTFTFSGSVTAAATGPVSYYWKLPTGNGPVQTLNFTKAGTQAVAAAAYKPASDSASGSGSIVVTSPGGVASNAAKFTLTCGAQLTVTSNAPATATVGTAYTGTVTVAGGKGAYTWAAVTGLPAGLTANASGATLTISGTPATAGTSTLAVSVHDGASPAGTGKASVTLTVSAPRLTVSTTSLSSGTVGTAYSATVTATGGTGADKWTATGLPAGLSMSSAGTISGTPTAAGTSTVTVTATDSGTTAQTATATLILTVSAPPVTITTGSLPGGTLRTAYSASLAATGGAGTVTWSASGLPGGLSISSAGVISGTPTASGTFSVTVTATAGTSVSKTFSITITTPVVVTTPPPSSPPPSSSPPVIG